MFLSYILGYNSSFHMVFGVLYSDEATPTVVVLTSQTHQPQHRSVSVSHTSQGVVTRMFHVELFATDQN